MARPARISMRLLRPSSYAGQSFSMQRAAIPSPPMQINNTGYKQTSTASIGVGMIDRLSKNVASCGACGH